MEVDHLFLLVFNIPPINSIKNKLTKTPTVDRVITGPCSSCGTPVLSCCIKGPNDTFLNHSA